LAGFLDGTAKGGTLPNPFCWWPQTAQSSLLAFAVFGSNFYGLTPVEVRLALTFVDAIRASQGFVRMSVTIYEIAERAGVSSSTVARILRGDIKESHRRSVETAQRIRRLASEMGYHPNLRARAFSRGRTHGIGLLYTDDAWIFEGMNTQVVNSLVRALQRAGYHLVFAPIDDTGAWEEIVLGGQIDGGVVFQTLPAEVSVALRERELPLVLLGDNSDPTVSHVVVDDFAGAYAATKHLIGLGHRKIMLFVHEAVKPHCSVQDRLSGYRAAVKEAGLDIQECLQTPEEVAIDKLIRGHDRPTAVVCYSNVEATLVVHAMWQYGVSIPGQLSVVGFNDLFATRYMTPPLTTVGFDAAKIGELGAQLVLEAIDASEQENANGKPTVLTVKPKLAVRSSTGPAPSTKMAVGSQMKT
jgi:DNA-binding LacI/PurR family transcriptional regulator